MFSHEQNKILSKRFVETLSEQETKRVINYLIDAANVMQLNKINATIQISSSQHPSTLNRQLLTVTYGALRRRGFLTTKFN
jgi:hypothetical protein